VSLVRTDPAAPFLRQRLERPARFGRYGLWLLGAIAAGGGGGLWLTDGSVLGVAFGLFGVVLIGLGLVQHGLLRRDLAHWPDQALLWAGGVELVLHNGEVRGVSWSDPDLVLSLIARKAPAPAGMEYRLVWSPDPKIPAVELSEAGFEALRTEADVHRLEVTDHRLGRRMDGPRWVMIRQNAARRTVRSAKLNAADRKAKGPTPRNASGALSNPDDGEPGV
jgi:hypothetical protein